MSGGATQAKNPVTNDNEGINTTLEQARSLAEQMYPDAQKNAIWPHSLLANVTSRTSEEQKTEISEIDIATHPSFCEVMLLWAWDSIKALILDLDKVVVPGASEKDQLDRETEAQRARAKEIMGEYRRHEKTIKKVLMKPTLYLAKNLPNERFAEQATRLYEVFAAGYYLRSLLFDFIRKERRNKSQRLK